MAIFCKSLLKKWNLISVGAMKNGRLLLRNLNGDIL